MKEYIILLVGKSGSGKTTLAKELHDIYGLRILPSYTERPMRHGESAEDSGHIFVDKSEMDNIISTQNVCAYTEFCEYRYCTTEKWVNQSDIYIIDIDGVRDFYCNYRGKKIPIVIGLNTSEKLLFKRMINRGDELTDVIERLENDKKSFAELYNIAHKVYINDKPSDVTAIADDIYNTFFNKGGFSHAG